MSKEGSLEEFHKAALQRPEVPDYEVLSQDASSPRLYVSVWRHCGREWNGKVDRRSACSSRGKYPKGIVYFPAPTLVQSFSATLEKAVGYREPVDLPARVRRWASGIAKEEISPSPLDEPRLSWSRLEPKLVEVATAYKETHGSPAVLIIDAADIVAKQDPAFFRTLQEFAKVAADMKSMRVVFVASEGRALPLLQSASAWSRALKPYEVLDIPDVEAVKVLTDKGIDKAVAESAVAEVTGGRFSLLLRAASVLKFETVESWRAQLNTKTLKAIQQVGVKADNKLFEHINQYGSISTAVADTLAAPEQVKELVNNNILAQRTNETYEFRSRHVAKFFKSTQAPTTPLPTTPAPTAPAPIK